MGTAGKRQRMCRPGADGNVAPFDNREFLTDDELLGLAGLTGEGNAECRRINNARKRYSIPDKSDVDREFLSLVDEFLGAIERVDEEEGFAVDIRNSAGRYGFFCDDRDIRIATGKMRENDLLGARIGDGHRTRILLE